MSDIKIKSFGKKQKQRLVYLYLNQNQKVFVDNPVLRVVLAALREKKLVIFQAGQAVITELGKKIVETELRDYLGETTVAHAEAALVEKRNNQVNFNKKLGKNQKALLLKIRETPLLISKKQFSNYLNYLIASLKNQGLIKFVEETMHITKYGEDILANPINNVVDENFYQIDNHAQDIFTGLFLAEGNTLNKHEAMFLKFISKSPRLVNQIRGAKHIIPALKDRELLELSENKLWITAQGQDLLNSAKEFSQLLNTDEDFSELFISSAKTQSQNRVIKKGSKFLTLYMQGLTYQAIGDLHGITRERVRQYLIKVPVFHEYLENLKKHKADLISIKKEREIEKNERGEQRRKLNNLAARFPEKVNELWDYEKNGTQKPEDVPFSSKRVDIWLRCPVDGHSWQKKPCDIIGSWGMGTSGCPECAKRKKKSGKLPEKLTEVFSVEVAKYWNYSRNSPLQLDPSILTTLSKKRAWFHCPLDNFEWQTNICAISSEYWRQGRSGCPLCGRGWTVESLLQFIASKS